MDELAKEIEKELGLYADHVTEKVKKAVDTISKETVSELKASSPNRFGKYAKDWAAGNRYESHRTKRTTVYNKKRYQLTHLLENGHAKRGGGRVGAKVHIEPAEANAITKLEKAIKEAAKG